MIVTIRHLDMMNQGQAQQGQASNQMGYPGQQMGGNPGQMGQMQGSQSEFKENKFFRHCQMQILDMMRAGQQMGGPPGQQQQTQQQQQRGGGPPQNMSGYQRGPVRNLKTTTSRNQVSDA